MTAVLARHAITHAAGLKMFQAVIVFGIATVVFGVSRQLWLSIIALAVMGAADTVSVVVRSSLVQLATPEAMRGIDRESNGEILAENFGRSVDGNEARRPALKISIRW